MSGFILSAGKSLFADNCAPCHQAGGQGMIGFFPNLTDDDWLYGGSYERVHETLMGGRRGYMPAFSEVLNGGQIDQLANYVASLSGSDHDSAKAAAGDTLFHGDAAGCYVCHGGDAKGRQELGAPNLTDNIWLWANVPAAGSAEGKIAAIRGVIASGLNKGVMPAWSARLTPEQIKVLTVYVHELGGGQ
jgi:cytochrome c oxidase cbb3-type subunit 3